MPASGSSPGDARGSDARGDEAEQDAASGLSEFSTDAVCSASSVAAAASAPHTHHHPPPAILAVLEAATEPPAQAAPAQLPARLLSVLEAATEGGALPAPSASQQRFPSDASPPPSRSQSLVPTGPAMAQKPQQRLPRPCPSCSFKNSSTAERCTMCQTPLRGDAWRCPNTECHKVVAARLVECAACGAERPADTLEGRPAEYDPAEWLETDVPVASDWVMFPEAVAWVEASGCEVDTTGVRAAGGFEEGSLRDVPDGGLWPDVGGADELKRVLQEGDEVRTVPAHAGLGRQRCGWGRHMRVFCDEVAVIQRILCTEDSAQVLLRFPHASLDEATHTPEDRRNLAWFDYEAVVCPEGTRLPTPPGGWLEKLLRFPFVAGDAVRVAELHPAMEKMRCGWDASMKRLAGKVGVIQRVLVTAKSAQAQMSFSLAGACTSAWWDIEMLEIPACRVVKGAHASTGLCEGTVTIRTAGVRHCSHGHPCRWVSNDTLKCEMCSNGSGGQEILHCAYCEYSLCEGCASPARVLDRACTAVEALSTLVRVGDLPEPWLDPIARRLEQNEYGRVALRRTQLPCGRAATHICVMGNVAYVVRMLEGQLLCVIHGDTCTAAGTALTNPVSRVDEAIVAAVERAFRCAVVAAPEDAEEAGAAGTVALLGPAEERPKAAGKLVWYSSARRMVLRVHPLERGVVQRKVSEIRERAKCHVSLAHGVLVKLVGLPNAVRAARAAVEQLLMRHRVEVQRSRVDKAMAQVVAQLCEVRVAISISDVLRNVLTQLHEPAGGGGGGGGDGGSAGGTGGSVPVATNTATGWSVREIQDRKQTADEQVHQIRRRVAEELAQIQRAGAEELRSLGVQRAELSIPTNIAGVRAFHVGDLVVRGADWTWGDQDGGAGQVGRVFDFPVRYEMTEGGLVDGWVSVAWPNRERYNYRVGREQEVVHARQEGEKTGDVNDDEQDVSQRAVRHKQVYIHLINAVGVVEAQHALLLANSVAVPPETGTRRDTLQQYLHQTTRDKSRVEHAVQACAASISREEERAKQTLKQISAAAAAAAAAEDDDAGEGEAGDGEPVVRSGSPPFTELQLHRAADVMTQHLENLRGLGAKMQRHTDTVSMQLINRSAKLRRELADEIKRQKFSGWDIILSIMQETGSLIEYKAGDDKLVLTGGEAAVEAARAKLRSLTTKDLYRWSRLSGRATLPPAAFAQVTRLQCLLAKIAEQVSGAEAVRPEAPDRVVFEGTQPQIEKALSVLQARLGLPALAVSWEGRRDGAAHEPLVKDAPTVQLDSDCDVCGDPLTSLNTLPLLCGHTSLCAPCLRHWVDTKVSERQPATCTASDCRRVLTAGEYRTLVGMTADQEGYLLANEYELIMAKEKLRPQVRQCHACAEGFAVRGEDGAPVACAECEAMICPNPSCGEIAHFFLDCNEVVPKRRAMLQRLQQRLHAGIGGGGDDAAAGLAEVSQVLGRLAETERTEEVLRMEMHAGGDTRPCPACGALVHKTGGCNSMTCACGQKFCHQCLHTSCELVEVPGVKAACEPERLQERTDAALAAHQGNALFEGWTCCDVCDACPVAPEKKLYACANCVNWYVCEDCEASGEADRVHPKSHLIVEVCRSDDRQCLRTDPPAPGPSYELDWDAILSQAGELTTSASFEGASPARTARRDAAEEPAGDAAASAVAAAAATTTTSAASEEDVGGLAGGEEGPFAAAAAVATVSVTIEPITPLTTTLEASDSAFDDAAVFAEDLPPPQPFEEGLRGGDDSFDD